MKNIYKKKKFGLRGGKSTNWPYVSTFLIITLDRAETYKRS